MSWFVNHPLPAPIVLETNIVVKEEKEESEDGGSA